MTRVFRQAGTLGLYVLAPLLAAVAPLLVIPAATAAHGAAAWAALAVGLSVGLAGAVTGELGWTIVGPQRVARRPEAAQALYEQALASRLAAVLVLLPLCIVPTALLAPAHPAAAVLVACGVLVGALSPSWYFIGLGRPTAVLVTETLPRVVLSIAAALGIAAGAPLETYGLGLLLAAACTLVLAAAVGHVRVIPSLGAWRAVPALVRSQLVVVGGRSVSTLYKALPTAIVAGVGPDLTALYAAADRPMRMGLQFLAALPQRLQSWIAVDDAVVRHGRIRIALLLNAALGVVAGTVFAVAMPLVAPVLFSGTISVSFVVAAVGGVLVAVICVSRGFGLGLVADGRADRTATAAYASAAVGLPGVVVGTIAAGVPGALGALVVAELAGVWVQWRTTGRRSTEGSAL